MSKLFQLGSQILHRELFREVFVIPGLSFREKIFLYFRIWFGKALNFLDSRKNSARRHTFLEEAGHRIRDYPLSPIPCPLCGAAPPDKGQEVAPGFTLRRCPGCGARYVSPGLSREDRKKLPGFPATRRGCFSASTEKATAMIRAHRLLARAELWRPPGRVLDVSRCPGGLLPAARGRGYDPYEIEFNLGAETHSGREVEIDPAASNLKDPGFPADSFDLIVLTETLEYLPDPVETMARVSGLLRPDGIIMVIVPNGGCLAARENISVWGPFKPWEHISLFDSNSLKGLGRRSGLELIDVDTELSSGVGYVGALMAFFRRADFEIPSDARIISVRVDGARGDTLLATPVLRGLHQRFPKALIQAQTNFPQLLEELEEVETVPPDAPAADSTQVLARYEIDTTGHAVDVMMRYCRAGPPDRHIYYIVRPEEKRRAQAILKSSGVTSPVVGIHPMTGSRIKRWRKQNWDILGKMLREKGYNPVLLGDTGDTSPISGACDLRGRLTERESVAVLAEVDIFIGLDSFLAHAAGAIRTPRVLLFGSTDPDRILCDLDTCPTIVLQGDCPYLGCRHDCLPDQWIRNIVCRRGEPVCLDAISPEKVVAAVMKLMKDRE